MILTDFMISSMIIISSSRSGSHVDVDNVYVKIDYDVHVNAFVHEPHFLHGTDVHSNTHAVHVHVHRHLSMYIAVHAWNMGGPKRRMIMIEVKMLLVICIKLQVTCGQYMI